MHKILVPVDGSDHSLKALHIACDLADKYKALIVLLYVLDPRKTTQEILDLSISVKFGEALVGQLHNIADDKNKTIPSDILNQVGVSILKIAEARAHRLGLKTETLPLAQGSPAENILMAHKLTKASTIVMGSRGGNFSTLSSFGSVSHAVFAKADCTCISVK